MGVEIGTGLATSLGVTGGDFGFALKNINTSITLALYIQLTLLKQLFS